MSKLNKNSINLGNILAFKLLVISAFSLLFIPLQVSADYGRNITFGDPNYTSRDEVPSDYTAPVNPRPAIYSISPKSGDRNMNGASVTIKGKGFVPTSVARVNGSNRTTTFIDSAHVMLQISGADMYRNEGLYITVWNPAPGGGFSNAEFFTVKDVPMPANQNAYPNPYPADNTFYNPNETFSDLTSNVVYGSNSFLPSGIIQWVMFAIIILLLVIFARKFFGGEEHYQATPLKHD